MSLRSRKADTLIVVDFETTGLSPSLGDRTIEVGAVKLEDGVIVDRFQRLMNPGIKLSGFIESYTGISNAMLEKASSCEDVMTEFIGFVGNSNLVAHNASFDRRFLDAECNRIRKQYQGGWVCSMLAARRIYQDAPNHQLGTLVAFKCIPNNGTFHRALADAEMTAHLWLGMINDIRVISCSDDISFSLMQELTRIPRKSILSFLKR